MYRTKKKQTNVVAEVLGVLFSSEQNNAKVLLKIYLLLTNNEK